MKEYYGIILPDQDPLEQGRYKVYVPEIHQATSLNVHNGIWCHNELNSFIGYRDVKNNPVISGSYIPLKPNMPVRIRVQNNSASIIGIGKTNINLPNPKKRDDYYLFGSTANGTTVEVDEELGYLGIRYRDGLSNIIMTEDSISLELNHQSGTSSKSFTSGIIIDQNRIQFRTKDATFELNSSGFGLTFNDKPSSYFSMTKNNIEMFANEGLIINAKKTASIKSNNTAIAGTNKLNLRGNITNLTGSQKLAANGNQVNIEGFTTVQLKSNIHIGLESKVKTTINTMMMDTNVFGVNNIYSSVFTETSNVKSISAATYSIAASTLLQDSQIVSNMGVAASVTGSLNASTITSMQSIQMGLAATGTMMLFDSPMTAASSLAISQAIPSTAEYADSPVGTGTLFGVQDSRKDSPCSVLNTSLNKFKDVLKNVSIVPDAIKGSR